MRSLCILTAFSALLYSHRVESAAISWGAPFELVSEADIDLSFGPVVYAQNAGDNIGNEDFIPAENLASLPDPRPVTVGSTTIDFEGVETVYGDDASFGMLGFPFETFGDATDHLLGESFNVTFNVRNGRTVDIPQVVFDPTPATLFDPPENDDYSIDTGNNDLDFLLDSQVFMDSRAGLRHRENGDPEGALLFTEAEVGAIEIYLNNLTIGTMYQVQVIGGADDRTRNTPEGLDPLFGEEVFNNRDVGPIGTLSDGQGNLVENVGSYLDLDEDGLGHVTTVLGTFTADATTQQIDFLLQRGRNAGISAVILLEQGDGLPGDINGDGSVDLLDLDILGANFNASPASLGQGDLNGDNVVDLLDLDILGANFGATADSPFSVPEPTSAFIALLGFAGSAVARRRA